MDRVQITNCATIKSVEIGDVVYMVPVGNAKYWHPNQPYVKGVVTKIGRKYFTVDRGFDGIANKREEKFALDGADCVADNYGYILYPSEEAVGADQRKEMQLGEIRRYFSSTFGYKRAAISCEAVEQIYNILKKEGLL